MQNRNYTVACRGFPISKDLHHLQAKLVACLTHYCARKIHRRMARVMNTKAAIWSRVSTEEQDTENQVMQLRRLAQQRGLQVSKVYQVEESAWQGKHLRALSEVYDDARLGRFHVLLVWALDRLSREGPMATLEIVQRLGKYNVKVLSLQEPWTEAGGEMQELLLAIAGWVAKMESNRRSERTKAGLVRALSQGKKLGRPVGSKDGKKRSRSGYFRRYAT